MRQTRLIRQPLIGALVVALVGQVLLDWFGNALPDTNNLFGAPFAAGASIGYGGGQFWLPEWIADVLLTAGVLLVGALVFHGRTVSGVIAAGVAVFVAYTTYLVAELLRSGPYRLGTNQLVIWVWMLVVVLSVWGISRFSPNLFRRGVTARPYFRTALAIAGLSQLFITSCGSLVPYTSGLYGAPIPVGESSPDLLFGSNPTFFPPLFVLNIVLTGALLLAVATLLSGTMRAGLISASVAVFVAYAAALPLSAPDRRANQLVIWAWVLLVVSAVWWINRFRRGRVERPVT